MSNATDAVYSIELIHDPHSQLWEWDARIVRLSDGAYMATVYDSTQDAALARARLWIADETRRHNTQERYYVDDRGQDAPLRHSVKA